jgi:neutral trehalase
LRLPGNISYTATTSVIPVDLQAFVTRNAKIMAEIHGALGQEPQRKFYEDFHAETCHNISSLFWNPDEGIWTDFDSINDVRLLEIMATMKNHIDENA